MQIIYLGKELDATKGHELFAENVFVKILYFYKSLDYLIIE